MPKKLTIEYVREKFLERGFELLESEYINSATKMKYKCPNGHVDLISWNSFKQGSGCKTCSGNKKHTIEEIKAVFEERGYKLLSNDYKNNKQKLLYMCPNSHINSISWHNFKKGQGCPNCAGNKKLTLEEVKFYFEKKGYILLSDKYINNSTKMKYKCPNGHINSITWSDFYSGYGCPDCAGVKKHTLEEIKDAFNKRNYKLLSTEYKGAHSKLRYECDQGHINEITWTNFSQGQGCQICGFKKMRETMYFNGTAPASKQQLYLHQLLGGELNYPFEGISLDISFINEQIYLEYDGSGHWLSIKYGIYTQEEFDQKERQRSYFLKSKGWREIRIISKQDKFPSDEKILELVKYAKDYLNTGHSWIHIDIDNSEMRCSQFTKKVDLGSLRKLD